MTTERWQKLSVQAQAPVLEALSWLLVDWGAGGTVEEPGGLAAYYPPEQREEVGSRLARYAADVGGPLSWSWEEVREEDWWESWKAYFRPALISRRLAVCPSWESETWRPEGPGVRVIQMDPGRAFGTGTHETSRLCLRLIDECLEAEPASSLLDVGSGSGILSVAAALLGVPRVVALDVDPVAAETTCANAALNGVASQILATCADLRAVRGRYDLVAANILYQVLLGLAPAIADRVAPGGRLLLSGMLVPETASAAAVYGRLGLEVERQEAEGEWGALLFRKGG